MLGRAELPALPGCFAQGETKEEFLAVLPVFRDFVGARGPDSAVRSSAAQGWWRREAKS